MKSADHARIVSNVDVFDFELDSSEVGELDQLNECEFSLSVVPRVLVCLFMTNAFDKRLIDRLGPY